VAIVAAAALAAPLALGLFPRIRLPSIVLEIALGIVIGPQVLGGFDRYADPGHEPAAQRLRPTRAPARVPAADVLPRDTELVGDLGLRAAGGDNSPAWRRIRSKTWRSRRPRRCGGRRLVSCRHAAGTTPVMSSEGANLFIEFRGLG
jgi:hypothetical protein